MKNSTYPSHAPTRDAKKRESSKRLGSRNLVIRHSSNGSILMNRGLSSTVFISETMSAKMPDIPKASHDIRPQKTRRQNKTTPQESPDSRHNGNTVLQSREPTETAKVEPVNSSLATNTAKTLRSCTKTVKHGAKKLKGVVRRVVEDTKSLKLPKARTGGAKEEDDTPTCAKALSQSVNAMATAVSSALAPRNKAALAPVQPSDTDLPSPTPPTVETTTPTNKALPALASSPTLGYSPTFKTATSRNEETPIDSSKESSSTSIALTDSDKAEEHRMLVDHTKPTSMIAADLDKQIAQNMLELSSAAVFGDNISEAWLEPNTAVSYAGSVDDDDVTTNTVIHHSTEEQDVPSTPTLGAADKALQWGSPESDILGAPSLTTSRTVSNETETTPPSIEKTEDAETPKFLRHKSRIASSKKFDDDIRALWRSD